MALGVSRQGFSPLLQDSTASPLHLVHSAFQPRKEARLAYWQVVEVLELRPDWFNHEQ